MKRITLILSLMTILSSLATMRAVVRKPVLRMGDAEKISQKPVKLHSDNTLIIMYDAKVGNKWLMKAIKKYGATVIYNYNTINGVAIRLPAGKNLEEAKAHFEGVKGVLQVNYDRIMQLM